MYTFSRFLFYLFLKIYFNLKVYGRENLPLKGPFILASNHESYLDPPIVGVACNTTHVDFMAKGELFFSKIGWWFKAVNCVSVGEERSHFGTLNKALKRLREGRAIAIFPEGQRSVDGKLGKPQAGIGFLASKSKAPIVPVYIKGSGQALDVGSKLIKRVNISARIGKLLDVEPIAKGSADRKLSYELIAEEVMRSIRGLREG